MMKFWAALWPIIALAVPVLEMVGIYRIWLGIGAWTLVWLLLAAVLGSGAQRVIVLNLEAQRGETSGFTPQQYLKVLVEQFGRFPADTVIADPRSVIGPTALESACRDLVGADLLVRPVSSSRSGSGVHDPDLLAAAFAEVTGRGRIPPWR